MYDFDEDSYVRYPYSPNIGTIFGGWTQSYVSRCYYRCAKNEAFVTTTTTSSSTTTTPAPCTNLCYWQWKAEAGKWLKYGPDNCNLRSDYFVSQDRCFCSYPSTDGTIDGQIVSAPCQSSSSCENCKKRGVPIWCNDKLKFLNRILTITFTDPEGVMPCIDGYSVQIERVDIGRWERLTGSANLFYLLRATQLVNPCSGLVNYTLPTGYPYPTVTKCPKDALGILSTTSDTDHDLYLTSALLVLSNHSGYEKPWRSYTGDKDCGCSGFRGGMGTLKQNLDMTLGGLLAQAGYICCTDSQLKPIGSRPDAFGETPCWPGPHNNYDLYVGALAQCPLDSCDPFVITGNFDVAPSETILSTASWSYGATGAGKVYWTITE